MPLTSGFTHCSGLKNDKPQSGGEAGLPRLTGLGVGWVGLGGVAMVLNGVLLSFQNFWLAPVGALQDTGIKRMSAMILRGACIIASWASGGPGGRGQKARNDRDKTCVPGTRRPTKGCS